MTDIFKGKTYAAKRLPDLKSRVDKLIEKGKKITLVSILVGNDPAGKLYVGLKEKAGRKIGINVIPVYLDQTISKSEIITEIKKYNIDKNINGIMLQLPLPINFKQKDKEEIIANILPSKDVDGLRYDSPFIHPTSKAVVKVLKYALSKAKPASDTATCTVCVVGSGGMVGRPLVRILKNSGYNVVEADSETKDLKLLSRQADVLISCCGIPGIIKQDMIKAGVILIDVGSPVGDINKEAYKKASFVSPVPGGIGPVTVSYLMENIVIAGEQK